MLAARRARGVDNDPQALDASRDNATRNGIVAEDFTVVLPGNAAIGQWREQADVVVANILAGPLAALSEELLGLLKPGGTLLLSGLLDTQADALMAHYRPAIQLVIAGEREGWVCLRGEKP